MRSHLIPRARLPRPASKEIDMAWIDRKTGRVMPDIMPGDPLPSHVTVTPPQGAAMTEPSDVDVIEWALTEKLLVRNDPTIDGMYRWSIPNSHNHCTTLAVAAAALRRLYLAAHAPDPVAKLAEARDHWLNDCPCQCDQCDNLAAALASWMVAERERAGTD